MDYVLLIGKGLLIYLGIVVVFETFVAAAGGPLKIMDVGAPVVVVTVTKQDGTKYDRILGRMEFNNGIYVATNHWPRSWYSDALERPEIQVSIDGEKNDFMAVPATDAELKLANEKYSLPIAIRLLSGFPPRSVLKLETVN